MNETPEQLAERAARMRAQGDDDPLTTLELSHARRVAAQWEARALAAERALRDIRAGVTGQEREHTGLWWVAQECDKAIAAVPK